MTHGFDHQELANAWIRLQLNWAGIEKEENSSSAWHGRDLEDGFELVNLAIENPGVALSVICEIIRRFRSEDLLVKDTEAHTVLGMLGAGPLEDLLVYHGDDFIDLIESHAERDARFRWVLRQVAQSTMSRDLWRRVRSAARNTPGAQAGGLPR